MVLHKNQKTALQQERFEFNKSMFAVCVMALGAQSLSPGGCCALASS